MGLFKTNALAAFLLIICCHKHLVSSQACDASGDTSPCSKGQICILNVCETAITCKQGSECQTQGVPLFCVADYCQPSPCSSTGECVYGYICSSNVLQQCVEPVNTVKGENDQMIFKFEEPGQEGNYEEITWYKGDTLSESRIVLFNIALNEGEPKYYGDYCSGSAPDGCDTSNKGKLNIDTGELTVPEVKVSDDNTYYYKFYGSNSEDTGNKFEYHVEVYVEPLEANMTLTGVPDETVQEGTTLDLTCTINRIKPKSPELYWMINGQRHNRTSADTDNADGTYKQEIKIRHNVTRDDDTIQCTVEKLPGYWNESVTISETINPGSGGVSAALIGGIVGGVVFVILIVVIVIFIMRRRRKPSKGSPDDETGLALQSNGRVDQGPIYAQPDKSRKLRPQRGLDNGPEYANANALKGENPYENTAIDNNNPPDGKQENGGPDGVVYTEVNIGKGAKPEKPGKGAKPEKPGKPKAKERTSLKKPKVHQAEEPTVYAEITPVAKKDEQK